MRTIRTRRLVLRTWRVETDADALAPMHGDREVMRYLGDGGVRDREGVRADVVSWAAHWDEHGFGLWCLELRGTGEPIGFAGLSYPEFLPEVMPAVEMGWRLRRDVWGRGLATEAGRAALAYGFDELGLERIVAIRRPENIASRRVTEKLGLRLDRETAHPVYAYRLCVDVIDRRTWLGR